MKQTLFSIKETAFNEIECNATDCEGCDKLVEDGCEGAADNCMQVHDWLVELFYAIESEIS